MRFSCVMFAVLSFISLILFLVGNSMTPPPGTISGNGNPALILFFILIPILICLVLFSVILIRSYSIKNKYLYFTMIILILHFILGFLYQRKELNEYREVIKGVLLERDGIADLHYVESMTGFLSYHVNNQYFNVNTFFMFLAFALLSAIIYHFWDNWDKKGEMNEKDQPQ